MKPWFPVAAGVLVCPQDQRRRMMMESWQRAWGENHDVASDDRGGQAAANDAPGEQRCILVVDDDPMVLDITSILLAREGYRVTPVDSALKAMYFLQGHEFDLVLTDLHMPEINGIALLQWIKNYDPGIAVMIITGDRDAAPASQAVRYGADEYLLKPLSREVLLAAVEHCLMSHRLARYDITPAGQQREFIMGNKAARELSEGLASVAADLKILEFWGPPDEGWRLKALQEKIRRLTGVTNQYF